MIELKIFITTPCHPKLYQSVTIPLSPSVLSLYSCSVGGAQLKEQSMYYAALCASSTREEVTLHTIVYENKDREVKSLEQYLCLNCRESLANTANVQSASP